MSADPLPPHNSATVEVLVVPGAVVRRYDADPTVTDAVRATGADAVLPAPPHANLAAQRLLHAVDRPVLRADRGMRARTTATADDELVVAAAPSPDTLPDTPAEAGAVEDTVPDRVVVVTDGFELRVVPRRQETVLDGVDDYLDSLPEAWHPDATRDPLAPQVTHASTSVQAGYTSTYHPSDGNGGAGRVSVDRDTGGNPAGVDVLGLGSTSGMGAAADNSTTRLVHATLYPTGHATATALDPEDFGLRAVEQVGQARAGSLRSSGVTDITQLQEMGVDALAAMLGTGQATARTIATSADALETGSVVRTSAASLPEDPVFIDIETDGLGASVAWLVGVLNGDADSGSYYPFRQQTLADPAAHLDAFATWLQGIPRSRPLVAWNGYSFDFDILTEQFREHCPDRLEEWESRRTFDLLYWARNGNNAVLPGRSNRLEAVAQALGWEPHTDGVDGATAARAYTRWREAAAGAAPGEERWVPDWDRLEAYCEDDVRALATVYEAIDDAPVRSGVGGSGAAGGRQGSLSDFS